MHQGKVKLGYWKSRGRAQVARQLLAYCGQNWEEKHYTDGKQWFENDKLNLGLPLPNLPYLLDGDLKLTQSTAIYRHILRKYGKRELLGRNLNDQAVVDSLVSVFYDIDHELVSLFWNPDWKNKIEGARKFALPKLKRINELYGQKVYVLGYLTLADLMVAEFSYYAEKIIPEDYKNLPFLQKVRQQISKIPQIKQYYQKKGSLPFVENGDLAF